MSTRLSQSATAVAPDSKSMAEAILAKAQSGRAVIQDFVPLAGNCQSLTEAVKLTGAC